MAKYLFIFFSCICVFSLNAQTIELSGKVWDEKKQPVFGAAIFLLNLSDSALIKGTTADIDGHFKLEQINANSSFIIKVSSLGYTTVFKTIHTTTIPLTLSPFILKSTSTNLKEVTVEAKQTIATQNGDTTSYNANAFKVNKDATAEDLVTKMPGVTITDGKVQAQGEEVKKVLVDGKQFFGDDANAVLKNLPAEVIDKVQVFDKKSDQAQFTGFDDGDNQKTINIVTKAQFRNGVFGKVYGGYGYEDKYKSGGVLNYFKEKRRLTVLGQSNNINEQNFSSEDLAGVMISGGGGRGGRGRGGQGGAPQNNADNFTVGTSNGINTTSSFGLNYSDKWSKKTDITGSYFFNWTKNNALSALRQQYVLGENNGLIYTENNNSQNDNFNNRVNIKLEHKFDSLNQITLQPKLSFQNYSSEKKLNGGNVKLDAQLSNIDNTNRSSNKSYNISIPVLYRHAFLKKGRTFSLNASPTITKNKGLNNLNSLNQYYYTLLITDSLNQEAESYKNGTSIIGNISYTEPAGKNGAFLLGYNTSYTDNYSSKKTYDYDLYQYSYSQLDSLLTNVSGNTYQAHSGSAGYRFQKEKFNFSVNTAYQWAQLSKQQEIPASVTLTKKFESILPSAQFQYKFSKKNNLRINYRTSNNAPSIDQLQNVINNSNPLQLSTGNPGLKQDFQHNLIMRYSKTNTNKPSSFFFLIGGNYSLNYIGNSTLIANKDTLVYNDIYLQRGSQIIRPENLNGYYSLRSFINYTFPISKIKTNLSFNLSGNYNNVPGLINEAVNYAQTANGTLGLVLSSNISEKIDFTISSNSTYSNIHNTLQNNADNIYFSQNSRFKLNLTPWKGIVFQTEYLNTYYNGLSSSFNQNISLWNAAIGYKFLKNKQAEIRITVYDILNQNNNIQRTNTDSYIQDSQTNALNRYYILTFTYTFKKYFENTSETKKDN